MMGLPRQRKRVSSDTPILEGNHGTFGSDIRQSNVKSRQMELEFRDFP